MYRQNKPLVAIFADVFTRDDVKRSYHATGVNYVNALLMKPWIFGRKVIIELYLQIHFF